MSQPQEKHGSCLCGAIHLSVSLDNASVSACHCSMCRKWSGGPLMVVHSTQTLRLSGDTRASTIPPSGPSAASAAPAAPTCSIASRPAASTPCRWACSMASDWALELQIYIDQKPGYYCFANQTRTLTGAEVQAQFS